MITPDSFKLIIQVVNCFLSVLVLEQEVMHMGIDRVRMIIDEIS
jgi:hypothetical protein